jgi:hypothetical protein
MLVLSFDKKMQMGKSALCFMIQMKITCLREEATGSITRKSSAGLRLSQSVLSKVALSRMRLRERRSRTR